MDDEIPRVKIGDVLKNPPSPEEVKVQSEFAERVFEVADDLMGRKFVAEPSREEPMEVPTIVMVVTDKQGELRRVLLNSYGDGLEFELELPVQEISWSLRADRSFDVTLKITAKVETRIDN